VNAVAPVPRSSEVTICIPAYGPSAHLGDVVAALDGQTARPAMIVICHSGAGDPARPLTRTSGVPVVALHVDERLYAGEARNRAAQEATTPWIAFLDSDVLPAPDWLERLLAAVAVYGDRGLIGGSIGFARSGGYWGMSLWMSEFSSHHPYVPSERRHAIGGFTTLVRRDLFQKVGGYPPNLYPAEDVAFCHLIREAGGSVVYHQGPLVAHFNIPGFAHFARHTRLLAEASAEVRSRFKLPGSLAATVPLLSFPMGLARLLKIWGRVARHGSGYRRMALIHAPGVVVFTAIHSYHHYRASRRLAKDRKPVGVGAQGA
jgi:GT2 family glycosyltransferase